MQHAFEAEPGQLRDLGTLPGGRNSFPFQISGSGLIVGGSENGSIDPNVGTPAFHAVLWKNRKIKDLGTFGGTSSLAVGVNDRGEVIGFAQNSIADSVSLVGLGTQTHGFIWQGGGLQDLGTLGGPDAFPQYVNDRGQVAGVSFTSFKSDPNTGLPVLNPFLWENGAMKDLGNLGGTNGFLGPFIFGLNNRGEVAGQMFLSDEQTVRAFLWDGEKLNDLGTLGGSFAGATGLNEHGEVIGFSALPGDRATHGFLWSRGKMIDLPPVDGDTCSLPLWINTRGQVVGTSSADCQVDFHAVLWEDGRAIDLNGFVPSASGIHLVVADNINDRGEIAGGLALPGVTPQQADAGETHVFSLIPCGGEQWGADGCQESKEHAATATRDSNWDMTAASQSARTSTEMGARVRARLARRSLWLHYAGAESLHRPSQSSDLRR